MPSPTSIRNPPVRTSGNRKDVDRRRRGQGVQPQLHLRQGEGLRALEALRNGILAYSVRTLRPGISWLNIFETLANPLHFFPNPTLCFFNFWIYEWSGADAQKNSCV